VHIAQRVLEQGANATFAIAGSGPLESELKQFIEENELQDRVMLFGVYNHAYSVVAHALFGFSSGYLTAWRPSYGHVSRHILDNG
jgi:hypothetical protein